ncbi:MAG: hypothetical protein ACLT0Y_01570 [Christensenellales bacterium]
MKAHSLPEVIASTLGVGPAAGQNAYEQGAFRLGPELYILRQAPLEDISMPVIHWWQKAYAACAAAKLKCSRATMANTAK